ncbi:MAG: glycosyltransferase [Microthrixaceae bacterium]
MSADRRPAVGRAVQVLGPSTGGIRVHVACLAQHLREAGVDTPVVGPAGVLDGLGPQEGVVPVPAGMSPVALRRARAAVRRWRTPPGILHAHGLKAAWTVVGGRPRRPVVVTVHNVVLDASAGRAAGVQRRLERAVLRRADRVIAPTAAIAEGLDGVAPDRIRIILPASPWPVARRSRAEVRAGWGVGDHTPVVVSTARLHPQKDPATLAAAWARVATARPDARLVVVGEGPARGDLEADLARQGLEDSVILHGFSAHAVDELAAADLSWITSRWEAVPLVLAESLALGVPVVSTAVGLAPELLGDGAAGAVVPVGDASGLAGATVGLLEDPDRRRAAGVRAHGLAAERFDPARQSDAVLDVYRELW